MATLWHTSRCGVVAALAAMLIAGPALAQAVAAPETAFRDPLAVPALLTVGTSHDVTRVGPLMAVSETSAGRVVAVGRRGQIAYSDDAGVHWQGARVPASVDLVALQFVSAARGWAVGHGGIVLRTDDGGANWARQFDGKLAAASMMAFYEANVRAQDPAAAGLLDDARRFAREGPGRPFLDLWFDTPESGFVVGAYNMIFHTGDGGKTWSLWSDRVDNPEQLHLNAIKRVGGELYIAGERGRLWKLDAAAARFVAIATPYTGTWFGLAGNTQSLVLYGLRGNVWRSADGARTWQQVPTGLETSLTAGAALDDGALVLASSGGEVLISQDHGAHFVKKKIDQGMPWYGAAFLRPRNGETRLALVGARGVRVVPIP